MAVHVSTWAREQLDTLQQDYHEFNAAVVPLRPYPTEVQFCKQVSKGRPCVFQLPSVMYSLWPALSWGAEDLVSTVKEPVEVSVTPSGNADSLIANPNSPGELLFVEPATIHITLKQLLSRLCTASEDNSQRSPKPVCYLQSQNSNLTSTPLAPLLEDLPSNFDFAEEVLGEPDARNIWIGDERSVTSVHRDPYENLYLVLKGQKTFRLWAPVDEVLMPTKKVATGRYTCTERNSEPEFGVDVDVGSERIPWVDYDPLVHTETQSSNAGHGLPGRMHQFTVQEGQILYLPAGWYHHVTQKCGKWKDGSRAPCIAVNYWYDMVYEGDRYVFSQLVGRMVELTRNT
jgi:peptidyl-lysine (3S)-dioxygenase / protease